MREALTEGDLVMIGKTKFRYSVRPIGERNPG
jgi:hypothetical protein